ncbi:MAG: DUF1318 domain-containing protein [Deltaproteobacteria bacterium]
MKKMLKWCVVMALAAGCAHVSVATKEPIKLDVSMRVDVYQHVERDVNAIEDMITGPPAAPGAAEKTSLMDLLVPAAYAAPSSGLPDEVAVAIERRKERRPQILLLASQGYIGENASGFLDIFDKASLDPGKRSMVEEENKDRLVIFAYVAKKNGASVEETGKVFADRIQQDAAAGTPIEESSGKWVVK